MRTRFEEYATSQAFALTLTKSMIEALWWEMILESGIIRDDELAKAGSVFLMNSLSSWDALERRGLIERYRQPRKGKRPGPRVTEEGKLVFRLLQLAGLVADRHPWIGVSEWKETSRGRR